MEEANEYLEREFEGPWNERYRVRPAEEADAHRKLRQEQRLESILSEVGERVVSNDYTLAWGGRKYQIPAERARARMRKRRVELERRLDGGLWMRWGAERIELRECRETVDEAPAETKPAGQKPRPKPRPNRSWMDGFWVGDPAKRRPPLSAAPVALRAPCAADNGGTGGT